MYGLSMCFLNHISRSSAATMSVAIFFPGKLAMEQSGCQLWAENNKHYDVWVRGSLRLSTLLAQVGKCKIHM